MNRPANAILSSLAGFFIRDGEAMNILMNIGTVFYTLLKGKLVGEDEHRNRYYRGTGIKLHGRERRWVLYKGKSEASKVPPEWHSWLHHTTAAPLSESG